MTGLSVINFTSSLFLKLKKIIFNKTVTFLQQIHTQKMSEKLNKYTQVSW